MNVRAKGVSVLIMTTLFALLMALLPVSASAASATRSAGASTAHPYSNPVWWPLGTASTMDCYRGNPGGCGNTHPTYLWDIIGQRGVNTQPVYAMGAGVVHIGARGTGCGHAQSRGDYLYIDHGNGVLTYYGHLGRMFVKNGQYVTARTRIAYIGNSGYARCHIYPTLRYLMVALKHGGTGGNYVEMTHSWACLPGRSSATLWPQHLAHAGVTHWNAVRKFTAIPATTRSCVPRTPATAVRPGHPALTHPGAGQLRARWARPRSADHVTRAVVQLWQYHPTTKHWGLLRTHAKTPGATTTLFTHVSGRYKYRTNVLFRNTTGYSAPSISRYRTLG